MKRSLLAGIARQLPEGQSAAADGDSTPAKRKQVSKRLFIDASGNEVDRIEQGAGARYVLLNPNGNITFDELFGEPGKLTTMCAIMGFVTKVGNVANTVLNDADEPGTPDDAAAAIKDFLAQAQTGVWAERTTGGVGARIDKDALAAAVVHVSESTKSKRWVAESAKPDATADSVRGLLYAEVRAKLESEPAYVRSVRQVPEVAKEYATRVGKAAKSLDELL